MSIKLASKSVIYSNNFLILSATTIIMKLFVITAAALVLALAAEMSNGTCN
jgi:hypothetical protein